MGALTARPHEVHLRLSEKEYRALEKNRAKCRLSQQTYLRKMCLNEKPKEQPPVDFFRVLKELQHIGINLDQIALAATRDRWIDADLYWDNVKQLEDQMHDLFEQILL